MPCLKITVYRKDIVRRGRKNGWNQLKSHVRDHELAVRRAAILGSGIIVLVH